MCARSVSLGFILSVLIIAPSLGLAQEVSDIDRFELFADCQPMGIEMEVADSGSESTQKKAIWDELGRRYQAVPESRLRQTQLYRTTARNIIKIDILFTPADYVVLIFAFHKMVKTPQPESYL